MSKKIISVIAIVAVVVGVVIGYFVFHTSTQQALVGAVGPKLAENYDPYIKYNGGYVSNLPIQIGANNGGTALNPIISGTCNLFGGTDAIPAYTVVQASCAVPNFTPSATGMDSIYVDLASSTKSVLEVGSAASSSAGYINVSLYNATSTASAISSVGTSTDYLIIN
jgi:hypothetical protein